MTKIKFRIYNIMCDVNEKDKYGNILNINKYFFTLRLAFNNNLNKSGVIHMKLSIRYIYIMTTILQINAN